jgi:prepilin-type N-terminal cleavage/methylation domain-containing protein
MMKSIKKVSGFTLMELVVSLAIMGIIAGTSAKIYQAENSTSLVEQSEKDLKALEQAYNRFYTVKRRAPTSIDELVSEEYYVGSLESPWGTSYTGTELTNGYQFSVAASESKYARQLANKFTSADQSGTSVSVATPIPTIETLASQYLHRVEVDGYPELNQLETDIDANGYNIYDVDELDVESIEVTTAVIEELTAARISSIETLEFDSGEISSSGNTLTIAADNIELNGAVSVNGNLVANGNDITGVGTLEAEEGTFTTLTVDDFVADTAVFTNFSADSATIDSADVSDLTYTTATIDDLSFTTALGDSIEVESVYTDYLESGEVISATGVITSLSGDAITYGTGTLTSISGVSLVYSSAAITNATISSADIDSLTATSVEYGSAEFGDLEVSGTLTGDDAYFTSVYAPTIEAEDLTLSSLAVGDLTVDGTLTTNSLVATSANVSGTTATSTLTASTSSLGAASATSLEVSGEVSATTFDGTTGNFVTVNTTTVNGTTGNFTEATSTNFNSTNGDFTNVNATNVTGTNFTGSNFTTSQSSVNANYSLATSIKEEWESCVSAGGCQ